jgi:hypothetical protein
LISETLSTSVASVPVAEDSESDGSLVADLFGSVFQDSADAVPGGSTSNTLQGVAVLGGPGSGSVGVWQYQVSGQLDWVSIPDSVSALAAQVIRAEDRLRFRPGADFNGSAYPLTVALLESSVSVASGSIMDASLRGGAGSLSLGVVSLSQEVTPVNDAPTLTQVTPLSGGVEDVPLVLSLSQVLVSADEADIDSSGLSFRVQTVLAGTLTQDGVPVTPGSSLLGSGSPWVWTPPANANGALDAFTVVAWDGSRASATPVTVTVTVESVNDAPVNTVPGVQVVAEDARLNFTDAATVLDHAGQPSI